MAIHQGRLRVWVALLSGLYATCAAAQDPFTTKLLLDKEQKLQLFNQKQRQDLLAPGEKKSLLVMPVVAPDGKTSLVTDKGVPLPVSSKELIKLNSAPKGVAIPVTVSVANGELSVHEWSLRATDSWKLEKQKLPEATYGKLHKSFDDLDKTIQSLQVGAVAPTTSPELVASLQQTAEQIVEAYEPSMAPDAQQALGRQYAYVQSLLKATYGHSDLYQPIVYKRIYESSRAAVALYHRGWERHYGSGVLIGKNVVLTCRHCVDEDAFGGLLDPSSMEVRFDYEENLIPVAFEVDEFLFVGMPNDRTPANLDFALLKLKPRNMAPEGANPILKDAGELYPAAKLAGENVRLSRDEPLVVIGHPEGKPRAVHDNSFVLFPFTANQQKFAELRLAVTQEFDLELLTADQAEKNALTQQRQEALDQLEDSYLPIDAQHPFRELYHVNVGKLPCHTADCDTYHGNSGSGVWTRRQNLVIGLLFAGEPDQSIGAASYRPGWRRHEKILPSSEIIKQLDAKLPAGWRATYGVKVGI